MGNKLDSRSFNTCDIHFTQNKRANQWHARDLESPHKAIGQLFNGDLMRLTLFRSYLSLPQCFYLLVSLVQQYYCLYKSLGRVIVSMQLCYVNRFGQMKLKYNQHQIYGLQIEEKQYCNSFVSCISNILQLISGMSGEKDAFQSSQFRLFNDKIVKLIYRHHRNDQQLYNHLLQEANYFISAYSMEGNLIPAIIRLQQQRQKQFTDYSQLSSKFHHRNKMRKISLHENISALEDPSYQNNGNNNDDSTRINSHRKVEDTFHHYNIQSSFKTNRYPVYRHKVTKTEGQDYFNQHHKEKSQNMSQIHQTYANYAAQKEYYPSEASQKFISSIQIPQQSQRKHISAQYSFNIYSQQFKTAVIPPQQQPNKKVCFESQKFVKNHQRSQKSHPFSHNRQKTSIELNNKNQKEINPTKQSYAKSILQDLARSVEVRDQPSSKSMIF